MLIGYGAIRSWKENYKGSHANRNYCFRSLGMWRGERTEGIGACFTNIYDPIKIGAGGKK